MNGPFACPNCCGDTEWIATTNPFAYYCRRCDVRFKTVSADVDGVFRFPAEDANADIIYNKTLAYVAFEKDWPEHATP